MIEKCNRPAAILDKMPAHGFIWDIQRVCHWRKVHTGVLLSGYINDTHTYVPGPDGKFGYGGKCFPKDVNAFAKMTEGTPLGTLLEHLHELNVHFRGVEEHI